MQYALKASYRFDFGTLEEIAGYNNERDHRGIDSNSYVGVPGLDLLYDADSKTYTNETRFVSSLDGPLNFVVGAYYKDLDRATSLDLVGGGALFGLSGDYFNSAHFKIQEYAIYGEAYYNITDALKATVGLRQFWERVETPGLTTVGGTVLSQTDGTGNFDSNTPKFGLSYQLDPDILLFTNVAEGYRAGGVNPIPAIGDRTSFRATNRIAPGAMKAASSPPGSTASFSPTPPAITSSGAISRSRASRPIRRSATPPMPARRTPRASSLRRSRCRCPACNWSSTPAISTRSSMSPHRAPPPARRCRACPNGA